MTNPDLAALSEAATQQACAEAGVIYDWYQWQKADRPTIVPPAIGDMDGFLYNAVTALALRIEAERAGRLVQIDNGMREMIFQAAANFLAEIDPATRVDALTVKQGYDFADAAIAAMMGGAK